jgi:hypothetical protein
MSHDDDLEDVRPSPSAEPDFDELAAERYFASLRPGADGPSDGDVPAGFERVDALFRSASAPASEAELAGLTSALQMFAQERPSVVTGGSRPGRRFAIGGLVAAVLLSGGATAAYAGVLPDPVQEFAHNVFNAPAPDRSGDGDGSGSTPEGVVPSGGEPGAPGQGIDPGATTPAPDGSSDPTAGLPGAADRSDEGRGAPVTPPGQTKAPKPTKTSKPTDTGKPEKTTPPGQVDRTDKAPPPGQNRRTAQATSSGRATTPTQSEQGQGQGQGQGQDQGKSQATPSNTKKASLTAEAAPTA